MKGKFAFEKYNKKSTIRVHLPIDNIDDLKDYGFPKDQYTEI